MSRLPADFRAGVRDVAPSLVGFVPFALIVGVAAVDVGLSPVAAVAFSVSAFAGASQLAAIRLLGRDAPFLIVVLTAAVINLRMLMYSASIAPYFRDLRTRWKALLSYFLTDHSYAFSVAAYAGDEVSDRRWYYLGVALPMWSVWQVGTAVGAVLGAGVPESWGLSFAVPLVFVALLVPTVTDRAAAAAAVVGGVTAVAATGLPLDLGLLAGALAGVAAGRLAGVALDVEVETGPGTPGDEDADPVDDGGER
jgi:4-azaleucine resistance transporter AzlC